MLPDLSKPVACPALGKADISVEQQQSEHAGEILSQLDWPHATSLELR
jgi:hypothetical protein